MMSDQVLYAPKADNNPWRVDDMKTPEEWLEISLWYPFSIRNTIFDGSWYEMACCKNREEAYQVMRAIEAANRYATNCYIVVQCFRYGKEGREKAIIFSPNERQVKEALAKALRKEVKDL